MIEPESVIVPNDANPEPGDGNAIHLYVVYGPGTLDYPGRHVVRRQVVKRGRVEVDRDPMAVVATLEAARAAVPPGLHRLGRQADDDAVILESWI